jgi:AraC-like DNA-binding protein
MSIAEVAVVSGMGSTEYLWNAFDQVLGVSPSGYRKAARSGEE